MANLGEILAKLAEGLGTGAQHAFATKTRGGDYLQDEERLGLQGEQAALGQGAAVRDALLRQAALRAAAEEAGRRGVASPGADDMTASAELDESRKSSAEEAALEKSSTMSALNEARATGAVTPALQAKLDAAIKQTLLRGGSAADVARIRADSVTDAARIRGANRPAPSEGQAIPWTKDGVQGFLFTKSGRFQPGPGGQKTPGEAAQAKSADTSAMISALEAMEQLPPGLLGPTAKLGADMRSGVVAEALGVNPPTEEFANAQALVGGVRDDIIHALTGAAASVPEMRRLIQHIPDTNQRDTVFAANVRLTKLGLQLVEGLKRGILTPEEATAKVLQALGSPRAPRAAAPAPTAAAPAAAAPRRIKVDAQGNPIG